LFRNLQVNIYPIEQLNKRIRREFSVQTKHDGHQRETERIFAEDNESFRSFSRETQPLIVVWERMSEAIHDAAQNPIGYGLYAS